MRATESVSDKSRKQKPARKKMVRWRFGFIILIGKRVACDLNKAQDERQDEYYHMSLCIPVYLWLYRFHIWIEDRKRERAGKREEKNANPIEVK